METRLNHPNEGLPHEDTPRFGKVLRRLLELYRLSNRNLALGLRGFVAGAVGIPSPKGSSVVFRRFAFSFFVRADGRAGP
jgi:hypothetical protein